MKVPGMLLLLLGLAAYASADCNILQRLKVKMQWAKAYGFGAERAKFGNSLWTSIFNYAPDARDLFDSVKSKEMQSPQFKAHVARVIGGLDRVISMLDNEEALNADLEHLKSQHDPRELDALNFVVFGKALFATVGGKFGVCFDLPAWESCYKVIARGITGDDMFN
uniref:Extracellular globin n=2 Tax=Lamellibrachia luymesi TaxID=238240 RepID=A0A0S2MLM6_LAMLU|nr:hemoglobin subunit A1 [Lamellibrachia luymesi]